MRCNYTYSSFGELEERSGQTENNYQFAGEQFDETLGEYYLRQRYYDSNLGRFTRRDSYEGNTAAPGSLHKYLYVSNNPANYIDPTGLFTIADTSAANSVREILAGIQADAGGYLVSATLHGGDYELRDFVTDLAWNAAFAVAPIVIPAATRAIASAFEQAQALRGAARILYFADNPVDSAIGAQFGQAILSNTVSQRTYSRLQGLGADVYLNFVDRPTSGGNAIAGVTEVVRSNYGSPSVTIYMQNNGTAREAVATLVHESSHVERGLRGIPQTTRYEEYVAFRREFL